MPDHNKPPYSKDPPPLGCGKCAVIAGGYWLTSACPVHGHLVPLEQREEGER